MAAIIGPLCTPGTMARPLYSLFLSVFTQHAKLQKEHRVSESG